MRKKKNCNGCKALSSIGYNRYMCGLSYPVETATILVSLGNGVVEAPYPKPLEICPKPMNNADYYYLSKQK